MNPLSDLETFSHTGARPLRPYQLEAGRAIARSVIERRGNTYTVMMARQMGKNETSAQLEAYLLALFAGRGGGIVKAAPSFKPQIINSILRAKEVLAASPLTRAHWQPSFGYMLRLGRASITFLSADRSANVVGATASLLLEIDEAQDVDLDKYEREFRPMASAGNATIVLYGTAWEEDSILERQKRINLDIEARTGERLHFEYDWTHLAAGNTHYRAFVEAEIARLGDDHPSIRTQYRLETLTDAGRLFDVEQRRRLAGEHQRLRGPEPGKTYVAGIDLAGADEESEDAAVRAGCRRDSTVVTIAELDRDREGQPVGRIVEHVWWTGRGQVWQFERLLALWDRWHFSRVAVDASGIGAGLAAFLKARHPDRTEAVTFSAPLKSRLAYQLLAMLNTGRLSVYQSDGSPEANELWREVAACRYWLRANQTMGWAVPESEGHDDFVSSLALCGHAIEKSAPPAVSGLVRATLWDDRW
ncbi:MAG: hypothetical protein ACRDFS_11875 [Chloroflexota bacterium]